MADLAALAELSHALERVALGLATDGLDTHMIAVELEVQTGGEREALAITLSYLLRHQTLSDTPDQRALDTATDAVVLALRRLSGSR
jgi:hypothetical protein